MSEEIKRDSVEWEPVAAGACFAIAVLSIGFGFVFTTQWLLDAQIHPLLHDIGLTLLMVGIPIVILGGHFMDLRDKKTKHHVLLGLVLVLSIFWLHAGNVNAQMRIEDVGFDLYRNNCRVLFDRDRLRECV